MKKLFFLAMIFGAGLITGILVRGDHALATCADQSTHKVGDTNADGQVNITDAIYLLQVLFDNPEGCQVALLGSPLPATGQTQCYTAGVEEAECIDASYPGQDGFYRAGCPMEGRFTSGAEGIVTDNCTGLHWQQGTALPAPDLDPEQDGTVTWAQALQYCDRLLFLNDGTWTVDEDEAARPEHGGIRFDDWRLPNVHELHSILNYDLPTNFDPQAFSIAGTGWFWTSTTSLKGTSTALCVLFGEPYTRGPDDGQGPVSVGYKEMALTYVRAVRGP
jgi:hypothetical protein